MIENLLYLGASTLDERCSWAAGTRPVKPLFCPSPLKTKDPSFMLDDAILSKTINKKVYRRSVFFYQQFLTKTMSCIFYFHVFFPGMCSEIQILHSCSLQLLLEKYWYHVRVINYPFRHPLLHCFSFT